MSIHGWQKTTPIQYVCDISEFQWSQFSMSGKQIIPCHDSTCNQIEESYWLLRDCYTLTRGKFCGSHNCEVFFTVCFTPIWNWLYLIWEVQVIGERAIEAVLRQFSRCGLILGMSNVMVSGFCPYAKQVANAMANTPQSLPFCCCWTLT